MTLPPVLASELRLGFADLAREIPCPLRVEQQPRGDEQHGDHRGQRGRAPGPPGECEPQRRGGHQHDREQRGQRKLLDLGATRDRVDRRSRPPLEREPFTETVGQLFRRAAGPGGGAGDAGGLGQRPADGERDAGDAPDPVRILRHHDRRQPTGGDAHRHRIELARRVVAAPQEADVRALGKAEPRPRDDGVLGRPEIGVRGDQREAGRVDRGDRERVAVRRPGAPGQREIARGKNLRFGRGKPRSRNGNGDVNGEAAEQREREQRERGSHCTAGGGLRAAARRGLHVNVPRRLRVTGAARGHRLVQRALWLFRICQSVNTRMRRSNHNDQLSM